MNSKLDRTIVSVGVALFLIFSINIKNYAAAVGLCLLLFSSFKLVYYRKLLTITLDKELKLWIYSIVGFIIIVFISSLPNAGVGVSSIDSLTRLILALPVFFLVKRVGLDLKIVIIGSAIGGIFAGLHSYYQIEILNLCMSSGFSNHIIFGQLAIILLLFSIYGVINYPNKLLKLLFVVAIIFSSYAVLTSGSRGGWLAIPAVFMLLVRYNVWKFAWWKKLSVILLSFTIIVVAYLNNPMVKARVNNAAINVAAYFTENRVETSSGMRLEMWKAALVISKQNYGVGVGEDGYDVNMNKLVAQNKVNSAILPFHEPHNYYLQILVEQGILGLLVLMMIFFIPLKKLLRELKINSTSAFNSLLGATIIVSYLDFMITDSTFDKQLMALFFAFVFMPIYGNLYYQKNNDAKQ